MRSILAFLLCTLAACTADVAPTPGPSALSGKQFTGNFTSSDNRCNMPGCSAAVEFSFDNKGTVTIRYLEDVQIKPGEPLLRRGVAHQGTHPVSIQGPHVRFTKERHEYVLDHSNNCLTGQMRHKIYNFEFSVVACATT